MQAGTHQGTSTSLLQKYNNCFHVEEVPKYTVEQFLDLRKDENGEFTLLAQWLAFGAEKTWEPLKTLAEDVPVCPIAKVALRQVNSGKYQ